MSKTARGKIEKTGKKSLGKKGTRYWFRIGDDYFSTFDGRIARGWDVGMEVVIEYEEKGEYKNIIAMHKPEEWKARQAKQVPSCREQVPLDLVIRAFALKWAVILGQGQTLSTPWRIIDSAKIFEGYLRGELDIKQDKSGSNRQKIVNKLMELLAEAEISEEALLAWLSDKFETKFESLDVVAVGTLKEVVENFKEYKDKIAEYEEAPF